jgi:TolB-like protein/Tfp pilus assembly protein PilF
LELRLLFLFDDFSLDTDRRELRGAAGLIAVEPQVFDLLSYLISNRDRVVSKDDILAAIWHGRIVSESALTTRINAALSAIGDSGEAQRLIKTLPRKGLRFVGAVSERKELPEAPPPLPHVPLMPPALPAQPSIAVLPFANLSGDPEQEYFADGIVEEIITALSRLRWLFVFARNSSFTYRGRATDIRQIGHELGVRYVLEGSVRKAADRLRITAQLIEAATGAHLWAERYDRKLDDTFLVQDEITGSVVGAIEPELRKLERQRAIRKKPETMDVWDQCARGMWHIYQSTAEDNAAAEALMRRAIELDPTYAQGHVGLSTVFSQRILSDWSEDVGADRQAGYEAARRAVELDDKDPTAHFLKASHSLLNMDHRDCLASAERAVDLAPNFAMCHFVLGRVRLFLGQFEQAIEAFQIAMRLSPYEPLIHLFCIHLALAHYHQGHYAQAEEIARIGIGLRPTRMAYRVVAACCGQLGQVSEGQAALAQMRGRMPRDAEMRWDVSYPYADPAHRATFIDGLRKAGWNDSGG